MSTPLRQSTPATLRFGPFLDSTDGDTEESALTIQKADVWLSKGSAPMTTAHASQGALDVGAAYDRLGYYEISLDATDTDTVGPLRVAVHKSGALSVWEDRTVRSAGVYDLLDGAGTVDGLALDIAIGRILSKMAGDKTVSGAGTITHKKADGTTECTEAVDTTGSTHTWS